MEVHLTKNDRKGNDSVAPFRRFVFWPLIYRTFSLYSVGERPLNFLKFR